MTSGKVAYLINQYPKVSHTFIRREILALERQGVAVHRYAVRGWGDAVADPVDEAERLRTRYVLRDGVVGILLALVSVMLSAPAQFAAALGLALRMSRRADRHLLLHLVYLAEACVLLRWCRQDGVSHVHAHFGTNPAEVAMLLRALGGPTYSFTVHGPEEFDKPTFIGLPEKMRRARFVVAISSFGRSQLSRWIDLAHWSKIAVVHCGIEQAFHEQTSAGDPAARRLVCVGRLCEQKAQLLLVNAARLVRDRGERFELVLAGDGEMRAQIESRVQELGLGEMVRITGWIGSAQVRDEILAARALVLPSYAEGLPVVLMEAMALGRPVVTTYVAGIPELVTTPECGWLVPAGDVVALADAMCACLRASTERLTALGQAGRGRALARHDADVEAGKLRRLFAGECLPAEV
jgi:glycosyltransferase involved in cell wall biosynthesis